MAAEEGAAAMVQTDELEQIILDFIREQILASPELEIDFEENLFASGLVDSLGIMRLIAHLEATLDLEIPLIDRTPDHFRTVRVMAAYLEGQRQAQA